MQSKTLVLAITGNIGSGKSTVLKIFKKFGTKTINADKIVKKLYKKKGISEKILKKFDTLKKREIAKIAFPNALKRKFLEKLLQPIAFKEITKQVEEFKKEKSKIIVVEVPLLFESGWQKKFGKTAVVWAGKKTRLSRLKKNGMPKKDFLEREKNQMNLMEKIKLADIVIDNSKTLKETEKQVEKIVEELEIEKLEAKKFKEKPLKTGKKS